MRAPAVRLALLALVTAASSCATSGDSGPDDAAAPEASPAAIEDAGGGAPDAKGDPSVDAARSADDATSDAVDAGPVVADAAPDDDAAVRSFAAGVATRTWVDTQRGTPQNGTEPAKATRTLATEIWYPAAGTPDPASVTRDAKLAPGGPYPLVLFVHGSSSGRTVYSYLTSGLARAGYIVAAADFPLTAMSTPGGASDLGVAAQVGDLSFLCDRLAAAAADASDALHGAADASAYVVVGHSTGGAVAELAAFAGDDVSIKHDPRVRAIVPLSGDACMFDGSFFSRRSVPVLVIGASDDLFVPIANNGAWVYGHTSPPHVFATLVGGSHVDFTDFGLPDFLLNPVPTGPTSPLATTLSAYGDAAACTPVPPAGTDPAMPVATQHDLTVRIVTAYLEQQLRGRPGPMAAIVAAHDPTLVIRQ